MERGLSEQEKDATFTFERKLRLVISVLLIFCGFAIWPLWLPHPENSAALKDDSEYVFIHVVLQLVELESKTHPFLLPFVPWMCRKCSTTTCNIRAAIRYVGS
jgi:hypothetical protein